MYKKNRGYKRPSQMHLHNDQLPFLYGARFSALPQFRTLGEEDTNLNLFIAVLYVIDLFGVLPLVTLPAYIINCGLYGIPIVLSSVALQVYTSFLLSKCWLIAASIDPSIIRKNRYPYAAITDIAFGKYTSLLVTVLLDLSIFMTAVPNLIIASQNLELLGYRVSDDRLYFSFCYWVVIIGVIICPLMWLGSPKNMKGLAIFSVVVVLSTVVLLWYCLLDAETGITPFKGINKDIPSFLTVMNGYSVLAFQFDIHPMLLTLQIDMQQKSQVFYAVLSGIVIICSFSLIGTGIAAYKFGSMVSENLLESLPKSIPLFASILLTSLQLCMSCAIGSTALCHNIECLFGTPETFSFKRVIVRSSLIGLEVLIAGFVPKFDVLVGVVGGTIAGPLIFILPPLLYRKIIWMERFRQRAVTQAAYGSILVDLNYDSLKIKSKSQNSSCCFGKMWLKLQNCLRFLLYDISFSLFALLFGAVATISVTYSNLFEISDLFQNNSPCWGNSSKPYISL